MSKTPDEALAFVAHILHGRGLIHFQTVLGMAGVPEIPDFVGGSEETLDRAEEFLAEVRECISCLSALTTEGRRKLLDAQEKARIAEEEHERRQREKEAAEERGHLPGLAPSDLEEPITFEEDSAGPPPAVYRQGIAGRPVHPLPEVPEPPRRGPGRPPGAKNKPKAPEAVAPPPRVDTSPVLERPLSANLQRRQPPDDGSGEWADTEPEGAPVAVAPPPTGERGRRRV